MCQRLWRTRVAVVKRVARGSILEARATNSQSAMSAMPDLLGMVESIGHRVGLAEHAAHLHRLPNGPWPVIIGMVLSGMGISISAMSAMPRSPITM